MLKLLFLTACSCLWLPSYGQARLSPYVLNSMAQTSAAARVANNGDHDMSAYIDLEPNADRKAIVDAGARITLDLGNVAVVRIPANKLADLCQVEGVAYVSAKQTATAMLSDARLATGVDDVHRGTSLPQALDGDGVVVGVIDAGFDYTHPAFRSDDRSSLRIKRVWEQGTSTTTIDGAAAPSGYGYGMEFDTESEILSAATDKSSYTHGTHVAAIAAGGNTSNGNIYYGVAPKADIVLVSYGDLTADNANISDAIAYIYKYAETVGKPCVINMSLGSMLGPHDGTSAFDRVADLLQGEGRLLVGSVGNFGAQPLHASTNGEPLSTVMDFVKAPSNSNVGGDVDIWADEGTTFTVTVSLLNKQSGTVVASSEAYAVVADGQTYTFTPPSPVRGTVMVSTEVNPANGKAHALVTSAITSMRQSNLIGITVTPTGDGTVNLWADGSKVTLSSGDGFAGYTAGDSRETLAEIGGTGKRIVSVGAFVTSHGSGQQYPSDSIGALASFSSRGPSADGRMKPEVTAPGSYIASAVSSYASITQSTVASSEVWNNRTYQYAYMEGTSMASPFVAGTVATWLQANPKLTPETLREIISTTSTHDAATSIGDSLSQWGHGKINAWNGAMKAVEMADGSGVSLPSVARAGAVSVVPGVGGWIVKANKRMSTLSIKVCDALGVVVSCANYRGVSAGESLVLPSMAGRKGVYVVSVVGEGARQVLKIAM